MIAKTRVHHVAAVGADAHGRVPRLCEPEIAKFIRERGRRIDTWHPDTPAVEVRQDRALEVASELAVDLGETTRSPQLGRRRP